MKNREFSSRNKLCNMIQALDDCLCFRIVEEARQNSAMKYTHVNSNS